MQTRPNGPGIYGEIFLPASTRLKRLKQTQRNRDCLPAQPDGEIPPCIHCGGEAVQAVRLTNGRMGWDYHNFQAGAYYVCADCLDVCRMLGEVPEYDTKRTASDLRSVMLAYIALHTTEAKR